MVADWSGGKPGRQEMSQIETQMPLQELQRVNQWRRAKNLTGPRHEGQSHKGQNIIRVRKQSPVKTSEWPMSQNRNQKSRGRRQGWHGTQKGLCCQWTLTSQLSVLHTHSPTSSLLIKILSSLRQWECWKAGVLKGQNISHVRTVNVWRSCPQLVSCSCHFVVHRPKPLLWPCPKGAGSLGLAALCAYPPSGLLWCAHSSAPPSWLPAGVPQLQARSWWVKDITSPHNKETWDFRCPHSWFEDASAHSALVSIHSSVLHFPF